eukprot:4207452-Pleurochrysis_carterae.AAC.1
MCARGQSSRAPPLAADGPRRRERRPRSHLCTPVCSVVPRAGRPVAVRRRVAAPRAVVTTAARPGGGVEPRRTLRVCAGPRPRPASRCARNDWGRTRLQSSCADPLSRTRDHWSPTTGNTVSTSPPAAPGRTYKRTLRRQPMLPHALASPRPRRARLPRR